ncbi:Sua5 family C-terminal domain-containing protein, partial [Aquitalea sp. ASV11]|uniref:Sua5 family C-terminal domain-containing protein n=1 Tax=Aquitalea sp. ASV11 TaxID=2795103 RepID=UPI002714F0F5
GACRVGVESTIVDLSGPAARILRPGSISAAQLASILPLSGQHSANAPRVPGALASHYAPRLPCFRFEAGERQQLDPALWQGRFALISLDNTAPLPSQPWQHYALPGSPADYASQIYSVLHQAEASGAAHIVIEMPPQEADWLHVRDRLLRASTPAALCKPDSH